MFKSIATIFAAATLIASASAHADNHATAVRLLSMPGSGNLQFVDVPTMPAKFDPDTLVILCDVACQKVLHAVANGSDPKAIEMPVKIMMDHNAYVARILGRTVN